MTIAGFVSSRWRPRFVGVLLLAGTMLAAAVACERHPNSPSMAGSPGGSASGEVRPAAAGEASVAVGAMRQTKMSICHRTEGTNKFILISVAESAVEAHLAQGDGRVGDPVPGQPGMKFGADCALVPMVPVTITFSGLSGNGSPFTADRESGFFRGSGLRRAYEATASEESLESRVCSIGIPFGVDGKKYEMDITRGVGLVEPVEGHISLSQPRVDECQRIGRNVLRV